MISYKIYVFLFFLTLLPNQTKAIVLNDGTYIGYEHFYNKQPTNTLSTEQLIQYIHKLIDTDSTKQKILSIMPLIISLIT